ncbi:hypothetical protein [Phytohabitans kaempferiae]|uniref:N-terminal of MaoC-like dehydratase domain-containing protein n=1 Tax=Phytohabitans kaempferiae TaxID=1620943 RepID=A0ABV6M311_9ACTN
MDTTLLTREHVCPDRDEAAAALLGTACLGGVVRPMWHWFQLPVAVRRDERGPDGHPRRGVPSSPAPGLRRMFAGGRTVHRGPLRTGAPAHRRSTVVSTVDKRGRSGPLTFVTLRHEYLQEGEVMIAEEHDIVYRPMTGGSAPSPAGADDPPDGALAAHFDVDPVVLFGFSALTANAHRIHYDLPYARQEGYAERVVHGPLQVVLMAERLRAIGVDLVGTRFEYRLVRPVIGPQTLRISARSADDSRAEAWVHDAAGARVAEGRVS